MFTPDLPWSSVGFLALSFVIMCTSDWSNEKSSFSRSQSKCHYVAHHLSWDSQPLGLQQRTLGDLQIRCLRDDKSRRVFNGDRNRIHSGCWKDVLERLEIKERKKEVRFPLDPWT